MSRARMLVRLLVAVVTLCAVATLAPSLASTQGDQSAGLVPHPAHIHKGTCSELDPNPLYPLTDVSLGIGGSGTPAAGTMTGAGGAFPAETSVTTIDASLDDLLTEPLAVNVHQSADQIDAYIACGDVGGVRIGSDLAFGLAPQSGSDYAGAVWLHDNGDGTTIVTLALVRNMVTAVVGTPAASPVASPAASPAPEGEAGGEAPTVEMVDIDFNPKEITIPAGTDAQLTLRNTGATLHDFTVDALGIHEELNPGDERTITINADAGDYDFYCSQPGHKEAGMTGVMHVQ